jgi:outer membrane lipoprotein-sorting protein
MFTNRYSRYDSVILVIIGWLLGARLSAAGESLSTEELRELQNKVSKRQELRLDFVQVRTSALRPQKPATSNGFAVFQKPAKFRWETQKPQPDVLLFDGANLLNLKPGQNTATRFKADGDRAREIREVIDFVLDFEALLKRYQLMESSKDGQTIALKLKPKSSGAVSQLNIEVDAKQQMVKSVMMTFQNNNKSEFQFTNPSVAKVEPSMFRAPDGVKIVDGL